jgi:hypothetical protein
MMYRDTFWSIGISISILLRLGIGIGIGDTFSAVSVSIIGDTFTKYR